MSKPSAIVCRSIAADDIDQVVDCLERGFPERRRSYWIDGLNRMAQREPIGDFPRYGYCLSADEQIVGVLLMICSRRDGGLVQ
ncbi:MAG TPA: acyl-CoA acyltransferase, partial [Roseiarcus sp.]|nr:acyl-CoA acyltransferase [Roseiarcus sp.]